MAAPKPPSSGSVTLGMSAAALQQQWSLNLGLPSVNTTHRPRKNTKDSIRHVEKRAVQEPDLVDPTLTNICIVNPTSMHVALPKERVLIRPPPSTLAQRLNLVMPPPKELTDADWKCIRSAAAARVQDASSAALATTSCEQMCPICMCNFGLRAQILLSCSHSFHQSCLRSYERHVEKRVCPLCRHQEYQGLRVNDGAIWHHHAMATRIQAMWRGYKCRQYLESRGQLSRPVQQKHCLHRMAAVSSQITQLTQSKTAEIRHFLDSISISTANCKAVISAAHRRVTQKAISEERWSSVLTTAQQRYRSHGECAICMTSFRLPDGYTDVAFLPKQISQSPKSSGAASLSVAQAPMGCTGSLKVCSDPKLERVLLSCTHIFHKQCLDALERYTFGDTLSTCPICRANYQRKSLHFTRAE